jgi:hypothetical protein
MVSHSHNVNVFQKYPVFHIDDDVATTKAVIDGSAYIKTIFAMDGSGVCQRVDRVKERPHFDQLGIYELKRYVRTSLVQTKKIDNECSALVHSISVRGENNNGSHILLCIDITNTQTGAYDCDDYY